MNLNEHNLKEQSVIDWFNQLGYKLSTNISLGRIFN